MITAAQIRAGRNMINAKQTELAKAAGISLATLNNIERAIGDPRVSTLDAIERALNIGGISFENDGNNQIVTLNSIARPNAYDTFSASQRVLETFTPANLLKVKKITFFCRRRNNARDGESKFIICILIEGKARSILFDQVNFSVMNAARTAEVTGILLASFVIYPKKIHYSDKIFEDTTVDEASEVIRKLYAQECLAMTHPKNFFDIFDDWDNHISQYAEYDGHPMDKLVKLINR